MWRDVKKLYKNFLKIIGTLDTKILIIGRNSIPMKPLEVIHSSLEKRVLVQLRGGREYRGILEGYDHPHLNLILRNAEEFIEGEKKRNLEKVIVRGDNIVYILP
mgnify:CR=1 FL=1